MVNSSTLPFTIYNMFMSMRYCLWLIVRINIRIIFYDNKSNLLWYLIYIKLHNFYSRDVKWKGVVKKSCEI